MIKKKLLLISALAIVGILTAVSALSASTGTNLFSLASKSESPLLTTYVVTFLDMDGNVIEQQTVSKGADAVAPDAPSVDGYTFTGWDTTFTNVQKDLTVTAQYEPTVVQAASLLSDNNTIRVRVYIGPQNDNLIQEFYINNVSATDLSYYQTLQSTDLVQALQGVSPVPIGGLLALIQNSQVYANGQIQVYDIDSANGLYGVDIHIKQGSATTTYTVKYVDTNGTEIHTPYTADGYVGQYVTANAITIDHYTLVSTTPQSITLVSNPSSNVITFVYSINTFLIDTSVTGGTIDPVDPYVAYGSSQTITYTPNAGYHLISVTVDGSAVSITDYPSSYTFTNVAAAHSISVVFEQQTVDGITLTGYSGAYDTLSHTITVSGAQAGDTVTYSTDGINYSATMPSFTNVTSATVYVRVERTNYLPYNGSATVTITAVPLSVTADNQTVTYGDPAPTYTATYSGFVGTENESVLGGTLLLSCSYTQGDGAGSYAIVPSGLTATNYAITFYNGTLTVNPKAVSLNINNASKTYGDADPTFSASVSGLYGSDTLNYTLGRDSGEDVGTYAITATLGSNPNYSVTVNNGTFTINPKALSVTADNLSISYGDPIPTYTASYSGFAGSDNATVLGGTLSFACTYTQGSGIGTYTITPSGLTSTNYTITFNDGTLTVNPKAVTLAIDSVSKTYGDADPTFTASATGLYGTDTLDYTLGRISGEAVGSYLITATLGSNPNYSVTVTTGTLTITQKTLTVTADNMSVTYGDAAPAYTVSYAGFVSGEDETSLGGTLSILCSYAPGDGVGNYDIIPSGLTSSNYSISFVNGTLTVNAKAVTLTVDNKSKTYGDADPILTASVSGLYNGDLLSYSLARDPGNNAGTYNITAILGINPNYSVTVTDGTFTINPKALSVTADSLTIIYGDPVPTYTATYSGFVSGENETVLGGALSLTSTYAQGSGVGTYAITPSGLTSTNYTITFNDGTLTVNPKAATLLIDSLTKTYATADPTFTATAGGLYGTDVLDYTLSRSAGEGVGTYAITAVLGSNPNYDITATAGVLTIIPADATITLADTTKIYGTADPAFPVTTTGVAAGDTLVYTLARAAGEGVGGYAITATLGANPNYNVTVTNTATLTITPAVATLTEVTNSKVYGSADPALAAVVTGLVGGDTLAYTLTRAAGEAVGTYAIITTLGANPNYTVTVVGGSLIIVPQVLTITANSYTIAQGDPLPTLTASITGFVAGEDETALGGALSITTDYTTTSPADNYAIVPSGYTSTNYTINYVNGTLTVTEVLNPDGTPLATGSWALVNLLLAIGSVLTSVILLILYFTGKKKQQQQTEEGAQSDETQTPQDLKRKATMRILSLLPAIAAVITFFLTEDMTLPMTWVDKWTWIMAIYMAVSVIVAILSKKKRVDRETPTPQNA